MQNSMPPLSALRAFEATARLGSVTAAAEELSVTHGAVSRQLKSLDEHFGVALFVKVGRGIALTPHGEQLQSGVGEAFSRLKDSCAALKRDVEEAPFTLACPGSLLARWLIPRLDRMHRELPQLKLKVVVSESEQPGKQTDASATLAFSEPPWPEDVEVIELMTEEICAVASPQLAAQFDPARPETLFANTLLLTASRPQAWPQWANAQRLELAQLEKALSKGQGFDHLYYLMEAAVAGLGVAIAPTLLVKDDLKSGRLIAPWGSIETHARLCLWSPKNTNSRRSEPLAEWLKRELIT
ncbi:MULTISPECIES: LysR family transcriptional regulator [unclassified Halomonas]|uniref:LysR family transcriptional regulator n=1 Tax=unclassified Halomonas TaxID=2609666 RepID=UPI0007D8D1D5|nr:MULTISPECIES: LysR family transcriptional regulator [unclassified Halomonas]MBT2785544.1 LysR family transcriptional regulator [Halomonas sp. ISL-106]MBT2797772.1 LysR family transcriptional regulator [Halomonas sp. ISL-104]OAL59381.1 transcriptional regulator [Halomonas sp. ALS9]